MKAVDYFTSQKKVKGLDFVYVHWFSNLASYFSFLFCKWCKYAVALMKKCFPRRFSTVKPMILEHGHFLAVDSVKKFCKKISNEFLW